MLTQSCPEDVFCDLPILELRICGKKAREGFRVDCLQSTRINIVK